MIKLHCSNNFIHSCPYHSSYTRVKDPSESNGILVLVTKDVIQKVSYAESLLCWCNFLKAVRMTTYKEHVCLHQLLYLLNTSHMEIPTLARKRKPEKKGNWMNKLNLCFYGKDF